MTLPVSTKWVLDAVGETGRVAVESVFMIVCPKTNSKGSGWLHKSGRIVTNEHVIRGCSPNEVLAFSSSGIQLKMKGLAIDSAHDLAVLIPEVDQAGGLELDLTQKMEVGMVLHAWGHPLGYNGPSPLLTVGYLAGFSEYDTPSGPCKHLVVNGAFNPGNSGGPLFAGQSAKVIGVVVSKHAPITEFQKQAMDVLAQNTSGVMYTHTDTVGNTKTFVESQLVADILQQFYNLTQVMIGEAIASEIVDNFLIRVE